MPPATTRPATLPVPTTAAVALPPASTLSPSALPPLIHASPTPQPRQPHAKSVRKKLRMQSVTEDGRGIGTNGICSMFRQAQAISRGPNSSNRAIDSANSGRRSISCRIWGKFLLEQHEPIVHLILQTIRAETA